MNRTEIQERIDLDGRCDLPPGLHAASGIRPDRHGNLVLTGEGATIEPDYHAPDLIALESVANVVALSGFAARGFDRAVVAAAVGVPVESFYAGRLRIRDCGQGVSLPGYVQHTLIEALRIDNLSAQKTCVGVRVGYNLDHPQRMGPAIVRGCLMRGLHSVESGECHGVIIYGDGAVIDGNRVFDAISGDGSKVNGGEPIYTKSRYARIVHNHVHNGNGEALINLKGENAGEGGTPGYGGWCDGNLLTHDDPTRLPAAGIRMNVNYWRIHYNTFDYAAEQFSDVSIRSNVAGHDLRGNLASGRPVKIATANTPEWSAA